jgi:hypothetical protein
MQHQNKALPLFNEVQVGDLRPTLKPQNRPICQLCKMELAKKKSFAKWTWRIPDCG